MAELGAAASVLGVANFGIEVAKLLYSASDVLIHAHSQIARLAKHVSQFSRALHHVGRVLETDGKCLCSEQLVHDIRSVLRSCRATLREIRNTTRSGLSRPLQTVRWLFKRGKAKELETRLDSQRGILQIMMHTVTVSRMGQMRNKLVKRKEQSLGID